MQMTFEALAGAVAGAAAVWVMDRVDWFNYESESPETRARTKQVRPGGSDPAHVAAWKIAHAAGRELEPAEPNAAGTSIHYAIGVAPGALYSVLVERYPVIGTGHGTVFGLGLFLAQDEMINSLTGIAGRPDRYPWQDHARGLVSHLVYGFVMDTGVRALKSVTRSPGRYYSPEGELAYVQPPVGQH